MAYNNGREDRKWRIWKEAEEKVLREHGVDEATIEQIRIDDRADFNSNRRFYHWTSDFGEYLEGMADREQSAEVKTVEDLLDEIEDENLYQALLTVDRRTLQIVLLKMKGFFWISISKAFDSPIYSAVQKLCNMIISCPLLMAFQCSHP